MKLAIVVDSSCGLPKKEIEKRGWHFLPLYLNIDGKEYVDGVDITIDNFLSIYNENSVGKTSCTPIGIADELIKKLSKENDFVVVYPISMGLSSQYQNLEMISKQYKNVFVVKSKYVLQLIVKDCVELEKLILSNELTVKQAVANIEKRDYSQADILLYPKDINVLVRGGRLAPSAAKLAKLLRIFPVIGLQNGNLEKYDKGVTFNKTFFNTAVEHYKKVSKKKPKTMIFVHTANENADELFKELVEKTKYSKDVIISPIGPVIAMHTGYGAMAVFYTDLLFDISEYGFNGTSAKKKGKK